MADSEVTHKGDRRFFRQTKPGAEPGMVKPHPSSPKPVLHVIAFGADKVVERELDSPSQVAEFLGKWPVTWLNVDGLGDEAVVRQLGELFGLHRLALEDVINVHQRAKVEQYGDHLFAVLRMVDVGQELGTEQLSLFLGRGFVLTFQENEGDCFDPVRERIRKGLGYIRQRGSDYLTYTLIDAVLDNYFPTLEQSGDVLDELERRVLRRPEKEIVEQLYAIKKDLLVLRRAVWPMRDAVGSLLRDTTNMVTHETQVYLRDCYDHVVQIMDMLENLRDLASSLVELHMLGVNNRMNEVMKVLTIITSIFIPLSFITGIYGMNFHTERSPWNMPELEWYFGYPLALAMMVCVAVGQVMFFRRKGWVGSFRTTKKRRGAGGAK